MRENFRKYGAKTPLQTQLWGSISCLSVYVQNGDSALLMASEEGHLNVVKILLQHHARVDVFDEVSERTFLLQLSRGSTLK